MRTNFIRIVVPIFAALSLMLFSCSLFSDKARLDLQDNVMVVQGDSTLSLVLTVKIDTLESYIGDVKVGQVINIDSLIFDHTASEITFLAYRLSANKGTLSVKYQLSDKKSNDVYKDTTFNYEVVEKSRDRYSVTVEYGVCASLEDSFDFNVQSKKIKKWFLENGINLTSPEEIKSVIKYKQLIFELNSDYYYVTDTIPIIGESQGMPFKLKSDMAGDHYYVLATGTEDGITKFINDRISEDFEGGVSSLDSTMHCYSYKNSGCKCLFLISIDDDWSYRIQPFGMVCFDFIAPENWFDYSSYDNTIYDFGKHRVCVSINEHPKIFGRASISVGGFEGFGSYYNVPYNISWRGDVSRIILYTPQEHTIIVNGRGEKNVTYRTKLNLGDNHVKYKIVDKRGNVSSSSVFINIERNESSGIFIENNIDNDITIW